MPEIRAAAPIRVRQRGGKRPGAGRKKAPPVPVADAVSVAMDVARHVDPATQPPEWTTDLEDRFVQRYYDGFGSMRQACQALGIAYAAVKAHQKACERFDTKLRLAEELVREVVHDEHMHRVMYDRARPAEMIVELKARDPRYKPVVNQYLPPMRVQIAITDGAFTKAPAPSLTTMDMPALEAGEEEAANAS